MLETLEVVTLILIGVAVIPAVAHGLELPGKRRLQQDAYFAVQTIYYPGFTIAGIAEPLGVISTIILLFLTPPGSSDFWLTLVALLALLGMQAVYWIVTHPVNKVWVQGQRMNYLGSGFFSVAGKGMAGSPTEARPAKWTSLRDRWEYSHLARAVLAVLGLLALVIAIS